MSEPDSAAPRPSVRRGLARGAAVVLARARFLLLVGGLLGLTAAWPYLSNLYAKLTRGAPAGGAVSGDTEYWCPMCPGVVSDWPTKCPVCHMALIRRRKGEMTPLPDGVVARVQLTPYRLQLAGVHTSPVEYRRLEHEVTVSGLLEALPSAAGSPSRLTLAGDVPAREAVALKVGDECAVSCDAVPGETYPGRVAEMVPANPAAAGLRVRVQVNDARGELRPGLYAAAKHRQPVSTLDASRRLALELWRDRLLAETLAAVTSVGPAWPTPDGLLAVLLGEAVGQALAREGLTLAVPEAAVIDTGARKVVYVEGMPGTFDAVEVRLGRRCGDFYPVHSGLEAGQRVVTAGAVLLDAETRLNPSVATGYFGAGGRTAAGGAPAPPAESLSPEDQKLIARQKVCPVTGLPLDSMTGPVRVVVKGRTVFVCCAVCEKPLSQKAALYLAKLPK